jgi:CHASE2 domain-containing sensor protein
MTPDGRFKARIIAPGAGTRLFGVAVLVAVLAGAGAIALLALWLAVTLIPIAIGAALIAYGVFRFKVWQARNSLGRQRDVFRP